MLMPLEKRRYTLSNYVVILCLEAVGLSLISLLKQVMATPVEAATEATEDPKQKHGGKETHLTLKSSLEYFGLKSLLKELDDDLEKVRKNEKGLEEHRDFFNEKNKELVKCSRRYHPDRIKIRGDSEEEVEKAKDLQAALNMTRKFLSRLMEEFLENLDIDYRYQFYSDVDIRATGTEEEVEKLNVALQYKIIMLSEIRNENITGNISKFLNASRSCLENYIVDKQKFMMHFREALTNLDSYIEGYELVALELTDAQKSFLKDERFKNASDVVKRMAEDHHSQLRMLKGLKNTADDALKGYFGIYSNVQMDNYFVSPFVKYVNVLLMCNVMMDNVQRAQKKLERLRHYFVSDVTPNFEKLGSNFENAYYLTSNYDNFSKYQNEAIRVVEGKETRLSTNDGQHESQLSLYNRITLKVSHVFQNVTSGISCSLNVYPEPYDYSPYYSENEEQSVCSSGNEDKNEKGTHCNRNINVNETQTNCSRNPNEENIRINSCNNKIQIVSEEVASGTYLPPENHEPFNSENEQQPVCSSGGESRNEIHMHCNRNINVNETQTNCSRNPNEENIRINSCNNKIQIVSEEVASGTYLPPENHEPFNSENEQQPVCRSGGESRNEIDMHCNRNINVNETQTNCSRNPNEENIRINSCNNKIQIVSEEVASGTYLTHENQEPFYSENEQQPVCSSGGESRNEIDMHCNGNINVNETQTNCRRNPNEENIPINSCTNKIQVQARGVERDDAKDTNPNSNENAEMTNIQADHENILNAAEHENKNRSNLEKNRRILKKKIKERFNEIITSIQADLEEEFKTDKYTDGNVKNFMMQECAEIIRSTSVFLKAERQRLTNTAIEIKKMQERGKEIAKSCETSVKNNETCRAQLQEILKESAESTKNASDAVLRHAEENKKVLEEMRSFKKLISESVLDEALSKRMKTDSVTSERIGDKKPNKGVIEEARNFQEEIPTSKLKEMLKEIVKKSETFNDARIQDPEENKGMLGDVRNFQEDIPISKLKEMLKQKMENRETSSNVKIRNMAGNTGMLEGSSNFQEDERIFKTNEVLKEITKRNEKLVDGRFKDKPERKEMSDAANSYQQDISSHEIRKVFNQNTEKCEESGDVIIQSMEENKEILERNRIVRKEMNGSELEKSLEVIAKRSKGTNDEAFSDTEINKGILENQNNYCTDIYRSETDKTLKKDTEDKEKINGESKKNLMVEAEKILEDMQNVREDMRKTVNTFLNKF